MPVRLNRTSYPADALDMTIAAAGSLVQYGELAPAHLAVRAFGGASLAAALALFGATWSPVVLGLLPLLAAVWVIDGWVRRRHPNLSPIPRLLFDTGCITLTAVAFGGAALVAAPAAYLLTASLLVLRLRRALAVIGISAAVIGSVYLSALPGPQQRLAWMGQFALLLLGLSTVAVLLVVAIRVVGAARAQQATMLEEAVETDLARIRFIAAVSHELRTPLTALVGFARLLAEDGKRLSDEERAEIITLIAKEALDAAGVAEDLLTISRHQIGQLEFAEVPVSLRAQAAQVIETLDGEARRRVRLEPGSAGTLGDPARVRQIIRNLVTNALRYGGENIRVVVDGSPARVTLEVRDDGPGLPPRERAQLFEPFSRDKKNPASVGLGLAVSRDIARAMGGELSYRHEEGESIFELVLPARSA